MADELEEESSTGEADLVTTSPPLTGKQRRALRALAHRLTPVVHVGQAGITEEVVRAVEQALLAHELIKVRLLRPRDKRRMAAELASRCGAALCGLVGHVVILYRPNPDHPQIRV
jgi:RNA-binding protein